MTVIFFFWKAQVAIKLTLLFFSWKEQAAGLQNRQEKKAPKITTRKWRIFRFVREKKSQIPPVARHVWSRFVSLLWFVDRNKENIWQNKLSSKSLKKGVTKRRNILFWAKYDPREQWRHTKIYRKSTILTWKGAKRKEKTSQKKWIKTYFLYL